MTEGRSLNGTVITIGKLVAGLLIGVVLAVWIAYSTFGQSTEKDITKLDVVVAQIQQDQIRGLEARITRLEQEVLRLHAENP